MVNMDSGDTEACSTRSILQGRIADASAEIDALYASRERKGLPGGWRYIGELLGVSGAYARQLATGKRNMTPELARKWLLATGMSAPRLRYYRPCLSPDPRIRIGQLARLMAECEAQLRERAA
jgi:hypothetical protein